MAKLKLPDLEGLPTISGIDYGSNLSGNTVLCINENNTLNLYYSKKGRNTDVWLYDLINEKKPSIVGIDSPLSLPGVYTNNAFEDYFYRQCDRELQAMSPMFIGGLTARSIKLKNQLKQKINRIYEVYPSGYLRSNEFPILKRNHTKKEFRDYIFSLDVKNNQIINSHAFDAMIAWIITVKIYLGEATAIGNKKEGLIYV
ncbi:hypothetical protein OO013_12735 [Mangrovivirga sp. M17]|uniref:DUF429 domain-containing protein n=1 Tax=Mangrovivirga halotolerans TaxID=2993936 RepID=A0ABT3RTC2_9BACT|nr:hypothetical protein [Mangrovivirga halotolerans]MCX2744741.1 hypothetical protein [Mangrovivirga halotolerans]